METVIADAGPLVAFLKRDDEHHEWTRGIFDQLHHPLLTCDAVLSEAYFLLQQTNGGTERLSTLLERGLVVLAFDLAAELFSVTRLLRKYESVPMSLADACLVRMSEMHPDARVLTLDSDFRIYRRNRRQTIPLISRA